MSNLSPRTRAFALGVGGALALLGCGRQGELHACKISEASCQQDVYYGVMQLRGDGFDPFAGLPPIRTITLASYRQELIAADKAQQASAPKIKSKPPINPWNAALQLLGLVAPSTSAGQASIDDRVRNVAAFYAPAAREVTVIDRGDRRDDASDTALLAHELVHAFQDRERTGERTSQSSDGSFAAQCFIEGEATLYEHLARAEIDGVAPQRVDWERYYGNWASSLRNSLPAEASPYYAVGWFVYPLGTDFLTRAWLTGGNAAVRRLGTDFPGRGIDLMASLVHAKPPSTRALSCTSKAPSDSFELAGYDRFGAMQLYAFLASTDLDEESAWQRALRWGDDLIWVYFDKTSEQVAVHWRIRMADRSSALELETVATNKPSTTLIVTTEGNDVSITAASDPELVAQWSAPATCK